MAAIAPSPHRTTSSATSWGLLLSPPEYAQGDEGRLLGAGATRAAERWRGASEYVAALLTGRNESAWAKRVLPAAGLFATACAGLTLGGLFTDLGPVFFPLAAITGLAAYTVLTRWVANQKNPSGLLRFAERVRRAVAYEGDPGSRMH